MLIKARKFYRIDHYSYAAGCEVTIKFAEVDDVVHRIELREVLITHGGDVILPMRTHHRRWNAKAVYISPGLSVRVIDTVLDRWSAFIAREKEDEEEAAELEQAQQPSDVVDADEEADTDDE